MGLLTPIAGAGLGSVSFPLATINALRTANRRLGEPEGVTSDIILAWRLAGL